MVPNLDLVDHTVFYSSEDTAGGLPTRMGELSLVGHTYPPASVLLFAALVGIPSEARADQSLGFG